jgi:hypothetical protein
VRLHTLTPEGHPDAARHFFLPAGLVVSMRVGPAAAEAPADLFGFSGACSVKIEDGFACDACVNDSCGPSGEKFKILWSGGDTVKLVNDETGMLAENTQGGRDYLAAGGEHAEFALRRGSAKDCAW